MFRAGIGAYIDARDAKRGADEFNRSHQSMVEQARRGSAAIGGTFAGLKTQIIGFAAQLGLTFGTAQLLRGIISTAEEFERLRLRLEGVTGTTRKAEAAFSWIKAFADDAPGSVRDVTQAFIDLKQLGIDPMAGALNALGNLATLADANIGQAAEIIVQATTGRAAALRQLGIIAKDNGDKLTLTFQGVRREVEKTVPSVMAAIIELAKSIDGTMARVDASVGGAFGDISLAFTDFADTVGRSGLNDALAGFLRDIEASIKGNHDFARSLSETLTTAVNTARDAFQFGREHFDAIKNIILALTAARVTQGLFSTAQGLTGLFAAFAAAKPQALKNYADDMSRLGGITVVRGINDTERAVGGLTRAFASLQVALAAVQGLPLVGFFMRNPAAMAGLVALAGGAKLGQIAAQSTQAQEAADAQTRFWRLTGGFGGKERSNLLSNRGEGEIWDVSKSVFSKPAEPAPPSPELSDAEKKRQDDIRETLRLLTQQADLQRQLAAAQRQAASAATAQAVGDFAAVDEMSAALRRLTIEQETLAAAEGATIKVRLDATGAAKALNAAEQPFVDAYRKQIAAARDAEDAAKKFADAQSFVGEAITATLTPTEAYQVQLATLAHEYEVAGEASQGFGVASVAYARAQRQAYDEMIEGEKALVMQSSKTADIGRKMWVMLDDEARAFATSMATFGVGAVQGFGHELATLVTTGKQNFADLIQSMITGFAELLIQAQLTKAALSFLNFAGIGLGSPAGINGTAAGASAFPGFSSTLEMPGFAEGGIVRKQQIAMVGERGAEAIVPLPDGRAIPVTIKGGLNPPINLDVKLTMPSDAVRPLPPQPAPAYSAPRPPETTADRDIARLALAQLNARPQAMKVSVNVVNSPSADAPRVETRQTADGMQLDLIYEAFENRLNSNTRRGGGMAPTLRAMGVDPGRNLVR